MSARKRGCPTPRKHKYPSLSAARKALRNYRDPLGPTRAYKCRCGSFHLTGRA